MAEEEKEKETVPPEAPPAEPPKVDPPAPEPVTDAPSNDELRGEITDLKSIVNSLAETVAALAPLPGDQTPTPKPWTHRTFG